VETSGPVKACNGIALPLLFLSSSKKLNFKCNSDEVRGSKYDFNRKRKTDLPIPGGENSYTVLEKNLGQISTSPTTCVLFRKLLNERRVLFLHSTVCVAQHSVCCTAQCVLHRRFL
jgi:hypothetical protein